MVSDVKSYWWSLLPLTNFTNSSSLQNGKTQVSVDIVLRVEIEGSIVLKLRQATSSFDVYHIS